MSYSPAPSARFTLIHVFAQRPLTGNPLALVPTRRWPRRGADARHREGIQPVRDHLPANPGVPGATWRLRSFTPIGAEVYAQGTTRSAPGSGWRSAGGWPPDKAGFTQQIGEDVLPVRVHRAGKRPVVSMDQFRHRYRRDRRGSGKLPGLLAWPRMTSFPVFPRRWPAPGQPPDVPSGPRRGRSRPQPTPRSGRCPGAYGWRGSLPLQPRARRRRRPGDTPGSSIPSTWGSPRTPRPDRRRTAGCAARPLRRGAPRARSSSSRAAPWAGRAGSRSASPATRSPSVAPASSWPTARSAWSSGSTAASSRFSRANRKTGGFPAWAQRSPGVLAGLARRPLRRAA